MFGAFGTEQCQCEPNANEWVQLWFNDCVYTSWETAAFCIGISSVIFWIVAQLPQFISNLRRQSADALSPWFLFQWLAGDSFNLLGCLLTGDQLATETLTAVYFIFADSIIISQYIYYNILANEKLVLEEETLECEKLICKQESAYPEDVKDHPPALGKLGELALTVKIAAQEGELESKLEAGELTPEQWEREYKHLQQLQMYHPVTFVTGRSGASMIAHAMLQNPAPPQSPRTDFSQRVPQSGITATVGQPDAEKSRGRQSSESGAFDVVSRGGELVSLPQTQDGAESRSRKPSTVRKPRRFFRQPLLLDVGSSEEADRSAHEMRRHLRRVVMQYGLEYGPPSASRLTIHHVNSLRKRGLEKRFQESHKRSGLRTSKSKQKVMAAACLAGLVMVGALENYNQGGNSFSSHGSLQEIEAYSMVAAGRKLLVMCNEHERLWWVKSLGVILGWSSSGLYLGSRVSQFVKNFRRGSADGLSLAMLICAALANTSYGTSIMMRASSWRDLLSKGPWLLGSMGTVLLDVSIVTQAKYLTRQHKMLQPDERTPLLVDWAVFTDIHHLLSMLPCKFSY